MSGVQDESFGINSDAYHVPKQVILDWMNDEFQLALTKIEQCATGAVYCQIIDKLYPGTFNLGKINWQAKFDYQYMENYKVLNAAFKKNHIMKIPDVDKLIKARYQDNLEFCQWIKKYHDIKNTGEDYDAVGRRNGQQMHYILGGNKVHAMPKAGQAARQPQAARPATGAKSSGYSAGGVARPKAGVAKVAGGASAAEVKVLNEKVNELKANNEVLDKEREFYFSKLRLIEELLQKKSFDKHPMGEAVLKVLYAGEDEGMDINENGDLLITQPSGETFLHEVVNPELQGEQIQPSGQEGQADMHDDQQMEQVEQMEGVEAQE